MFKHAVILVTLALFGPSVSAQGSIKLGFIAAQSGPLGVLGAEQKRGLDLALDSLGGKLGGLPVEVFNADSKGNPGAAVQEANKLIDKDRVDIVTGGTASNEVMAIVKPITSAGGFFIASLGGPPPLAGKECNQDYL